MGLVTVLALLGVGLILGIGIAYFVGIAAIKYREYIIDNLKVDVKEWRDEWRASQATLMSVLERSRHLEPETEAWGSFIMDAKDDDDASLVRNRDDRSGSISLD